jgi:hypothetical protein
MNKKSNIKQTEGKISKKVVPILAFKLLIKSGVTIDYFSTDREKRNWKNGWVSAEKQFKEETR